MTYAAKVGPNVWAAKRSGLWMAWGRIPHPETTQGINRIQENAYAIKKKENKECSHIHCCSPLEAIVD
jgi:hypothetical protein